MCDVVTSFKSFFLSLALNSFTRMIASVILRSVEIFWLTCSVSITRCFQSFFLLIVVCIFLPSSSQLLQASCMLLECLLAPLWLWSPPARPRYYFTAMTDVFWRDVSKHTLQTEHWQQTKQSIPLRSSSVNCKFNSNCSQTCRWGVTYKRIQVTLAPKGKVTPPTQSLTS